MGRSQEHVWQMQLIPWVEYEDGERVQEDCWEDCRSSGIVLMYARDVGDLSKVPREKFPEVWREVYGTNSSKQANLEHFRYDMDEGDTVYVKSKVEGIPAIIGKGTVASPYRFLKRDSRHWRKVQWDPAFEPILRQPDSALLGKHWPQRQTFVELKDDQIALVLEAEEQVRRPGISKPESGRNEKTRARTSKRNGKDNKDWPVREGQRAIREIQLQVRNRKIIEEAKRRAKGACQICGFRAEDYY